MIYKTQAIIIRRKNFGETDKILTVFTKNRGKKNVLAKGVRKPLSKLSGSLELFCLTDLNIAEGRNLDIVSGAQIRQSFFNLRNNLEQTNFAYYLAEAIDKLVPEDEPHSEVFNLLVETLQSANNVPEKLLLSYFELNLLQELGFRPEMYDCLICHDKINEDKNVFDFEHGGLVCEKCSKIGRHLSNESIKILRLFLNSGIGIVKRLNIEQKLGREVIRLTSDYLTFILQKELNSKRFILEA